MRARAAAGGEEEEQEAGAGTVGWRVLAQRARDMPGDISTEEEIEEAGAEAAAEAKGAAEAAAAAAPVTMQKFTIELPGEVRRPRP